MSRLYLISAITLLAILGITNASNCTVTLSMHQTCNPSHKQVLQIFNKLSSMYNNNPNIQFVSITKKYDPLEEAAYPNIIIRSDSREVGYENELSLVELEYWVNVQCMREVPRCSSWMSQPIFPINLHIPPPGSGQRVDYMTLIDFIIDNPSIKICSDSTLPMLNTTAGINQEKAIQNTVTQLLQGLPIFSKFTHNIRNYLLINADKITAVILFHNPKIPSQVSMKKNFMDTISYVRRKDQRIGYHISDEARKSLIFLTETPTSKMGEKLLQFLKIDSKQIAEEGGIIGFRFRHSPNRLQSSLVLEGLQYKTQTNKPLSNGFLFWLQQLTTSITNPTIHRKLFPAPPLCTHNQIVLTSVFNNVYSILQVFSAVHVLSILGIESRQKEEFLDLYYQKLRQVAYCQSCNTSNLDQVDNLDDMIDHVSLDKVYTEYAKYQPNIKFSELEIRQVSQPTGQPTGQAAISICITDHSIKYFTTLRHLLNFLLTKEYLTQVDSNISKTGQKQPSDDL